MFLRAGLAGYILQEKRELLHCLSLGSLWLGVLMTSTVKAWHVMASKVGNCQDSGSLPYSG